MAKPKWEDDEALLDLLDVRNVAAVNAAAAAWKEAEEILASLPATRPPPALTPAERQAVLDVLEGKPWDALVALLRAGPVTPDMQAILADMIADNAFHSPRRHKREHTQSTLTPEKAQREVKLVKGMLDEMFPERKGATAQKAESLVALLLEKPSNRVKAIRKRGTDTRDQRKALDVLRQRALNARTHEPR